MSSLEDKQRKLRRRAKFCKRDYSSLPEFLTSHWYQSK